MKIFDEKVIPERKITYLKLRKCDLCGRESNREEWESKSYYSINETVISVEIRQKEGSNYPEGGLGTKYEIDLCPECFKNKLIPWLKSQNANIAEEEWDW